MQEYWYVLFVFSGDETKICNFLKHDNINAFIPKMKSVYRKQGVSTLIEKIMFPGYVFVSSELEQDDFTFLITQEKMKMTKSMKLLKYDSEGTPVLKEDEQAYLKRLLNEDNIMDHSIGIIEGSKTIITEGPLKGLENTIVKIDRHKRRAIIELMICNQPTRINVSLEIISKTS